MNNEQEKYYYNDARPRTSRWDRYLGMTAVMTQVPVPTASVTTWVRHRRPRKFVKYLAVSSIFLLSFKELHYKIW